MLDCTPTKETISGERKVHWPAAKTRNHNKHEKMKDTPIKKPDSEAVAGRAQRLVSRNFGFAVNVFMCGFLTNSVLLRLMEGNYSYIGLPIAILALCGASAILHIIC
jgi:hypothetical protein